MSVIEKDLELINLVEQYRLLYDKKEANYKDKIAVQNGWESISQKIKIPASECQHRWEIIRNRYNKEKKGPPSGSTGKIKKEWPCLKSLYFLQDVIVPRKRFSDFINPKNTVIEANETDKKFVFEIATWDPDAEADTEGASLPKQMMYMEPSQQSQLSTSTPTEETPVVESARPNSQEAYLEKSLNVAVNTLTDYVTNKSAKKEDSDMMFCLSLCESLKSIKNNKRKNRAKISILQTLDEFITD